MKGAEEFLLSGRRSYSVANSERNVVWQDFVWMEDIFLPSLSPLLCEFPGNEPSSRPVRFPLSLLFVLPH